MFNFEEKCDRNQVAASIGKIPSPRGNSWMHYLQHRLRMMENGIEAYTTRNYARLSLDKHIEWHRAIDKMAGKLCAHKASIIYIGNGTIAANCPFKIKKHVRCPGTRKLIESFKKRFNCIVRMVDEYNTSRLCGKCFRRFDGKKSYRFKTCTDCHPNAALRLPRLIVTNVSKRLLQARRAIVKTWQEMRDAGDGIAGALFRLGTRRLVSHKETFLKTWQPIANVCDRNVTHKTVWHRDISAAKLILYRGMSKECFIVHTTGFIIFHHFI